MKSGREGSRAEASEIADEAADLQCARRLTRMPPRAATASTSEKANRSPFSESCTNLTERASVGLFIVGAFRVDGANGLRVCTTSGEAADPGETTG